MKNYETGVKTSALTWLIAALIAGFVVQLMGASAWFDATERILHDTAVSPAGIRNLQLWSFFTHSFVHDVHNPLHVVVVVAGLWLLGRPLVPVLGTSRCILLYAAGVAGGAGLWLSVHWQAGGLLMGGAAGVYALLTVFACFYPEQEIRFFLFFPVTVKPKHLMFGCLIVELTVAIFYEHLRLAQTLDYSASAHLGGIAVGWIYYRFVHNTNFHLSPASRLSARPSWLKRPAGIVAPPVANLAHIDIVSDRIALRAEVDRILDKINSHGFRALTTEEKRLLDDAKALLNRR